VTAVGWRIAVVLVMGVVILGGVAAGVVRPDLHALALQHILATVRGTGTIGWICLALLQVLVAASGLLPASLLGVAAGAAYGLGVGFVLAASSTMVGALLAFALSRSLFRQAIARMMARRPSLARFDALLAQDGWRIVCLLRMSPVMPFAATSYALGLSAISLRAYLIGTVASLPALLGYVFLGTFADTGVSIWTEGAGSVRWGMLALGVIGTVFLTLLVGRIVRRAIKLDPTEASRLAPSANPVK
jgi:uncharacterized membrane protein YdjX (TVP38/TMEM64 family)